MLSKLSTLLRFQKRAKKDPFGVARDRLNWKPVWTREIYTGFENFQEVLKAGIIKPDDRLVVPGNVLLNAGINEMLQLLMGATAQAYNNANSYIAVGNGNTAESASHTDLQGGSIVRNAMEASFPSISSQTITFKSSYASGEANFNWLETGVQNGSGTPSDPVFMLNRKQQDFGTKASGSTWTMSLAITIS